MRRFSERINPRLLLLLLGSFLLIYAFDLATPFLARPVHAQEGENKEAAPAPEKKEGEPASQGKIAYIKDLIVHMIVSVGCCFGPMLGTFSIVLVALVVLLSLDLRMASAIPAGFVEDFTDTVNKRKFKEAYDMAKADNSYLGRVLSTGMSRLQYGVEDAREAAFNMVDSIRAGKEQPITYLATIASLGPLIGLVGTVFGMIQAFMDITRTNEMNARAIAGSISHALVVTLFGVALAVPAIFFHAFFRNRLNKLALETGNVADDLLTQMYHNSKKLGGPNPGTAPTLDTSAAPDARAGAGVRQK